VGVNFYCNNNQLTSLQGAPASVGGDFNCSANPLTSLQYAPASVGGYFYCANNHLTSLQGAPASVGGYFYDFANGNDFTSPHIAADSSGVYWEYYNYQFRKHATNHHYVIGSYYADSATITSGSTVLYTSSDSNTLAANISYDTATSTITTNGSGVATVA
jgi:hypothetical protein